MKTSQRAMLIASIVLFASSSAWGQGMNVALLDVGYIFKNHSGFKAQMDAMKAKVGSFEQEMKQKQDQIQAASKQIAAHKPGSPDYKRIEEQTTKDLADLKVQMQLKRKEIMEEEARIYMATYRQVTQAVATFARSKNIAVVFRYDRETSPANNANADPRETLKVINRPVIFQDGLDISDTILRQLGAIARQQQPRRQQ